MKLKKEQALILSLIKDDLVNQKLLLGLDALGLQPADYYLQLSDTIFSLMGFPESNHSDRVFELYLDLTKKVRFVDISQSQNQLDELAREIYAELAVHRAALNAGR